MIERMAYLGPRGTFSDQAAHSYSSEMTACPYSSIRAAIAALINREVDVTIAPIENSFEGPVNDTVDALIRYENLMIVDELMLPVEQNLIGVPGASLEKLRTVISHPQGLAQCRGWLERYLPAVERRDALSTARAVEMLDENQPEVAAISTRIAAEIYGRVLLAESIQDSSENITRFVVLRRAPVTFHPPTGNDRTTLILAVLDRPGGLVRALNVFDALGINMSKIESRPRGVSGTPAAFREAIFHIDIDGHQDDPAVAVALQALERKADYLRIAGSYPRAPLPVPAQ